MLATDCNILNFSCYFLDKVYFFKNVNSLLRACFNILWSVLDQILNKKNEEKQTVLWN